MLKQFRSKCTVDNAVDIHKSLLEALDSGEDVTLDFTAVREIDLTFFQILAAAQKSFQRAGRNLSYTPTLTPELADKARITGFDFLLATSEAALGKEEQP